MGSATWLESRGARLCPKDQLRQAASIEAAATDPSDTAAVPGTAVHVAINGQYRGSFVLASALRPETDRLVKELSTQCQLALLSGDNEKERDRFANLFSVRAQLRFNQSPLNKLGFIRNLQKDSCTVMMVGDGLNDAGALKQADVGVAVVEDISSFSPSSDVIMAADMVPRLANVLRFARHSMGVVRAAFLISTLYNIVGIGIAASGRLSPVVCAILMPLSSVTVVAFACGVASWLGRKDRLASIPDHNSAMEAKP